MAAERDTQNQAQSAVELPGIKEEAVDILEFAERGQEVPLGKTYRVRIDGRPFHFETPDPLGELLLTKVGKRPCAFELIEEFTHRENNVVEPAERVDLCKKGLKGFITAHKEIVTIFIKDKPFSIERGKRTVAEILGKVDLSSEGYDLFEEKDGALAPLAPSLPVPICGCEVFHYQAQSGGSS